MEKYKNLMSPEDFALWCKYLEKGKRLGAIVNNPRYAGNFQRDATNGMRKLFAAKRKLLRKYNLA